MARQAAAWMSRHDSRYPSRRASCGGPYWLGQSRAVLIVEVAGVPALARHAQRSAGSDHVIDELLCDRHFGLPRLGGVYPSTSRRDSIPAVAAFPIPVEPRPGVVTSPRLRGAAAEMRWNWSAITQSGHPVDDPTRSHDLILGGARGGRRRLARRHRRAPARPRKRRRAVHEPRRVRMRGRDPLCGVSRLMRSEWRSPGRVVPDLDVSVGRTDCGRARALVSPRGLARTPEPAWSSWPAIRRWKETPRSASATARRGRCRPALPPVP